MELRLESHIEEVSEKILAAIKLTMRDVVVDVAQDAIKGSPADTGHNRRSIAYKVEDTAKGIHPEKSSGELFEAEEQAEAEIGKLEFNEGAVYSTSGYGGYLETGTAKTPPRPYLKPAMDRNFTEAKVGKLLKGYLGE
jgi:hypothetical protein